ncbi:hypothetical protein AB0I28_21760 [Phytomonospora sp. NPDC050363]|uniref:hypothetical protein n=1 Tax=Phytomonospora sp. NPDC050363 TaxID=3155642 RepID=UPI0033F7D551
MASTSRVRVILSGGLVVAAIAAFVALELSGDDDDGPSGTPTTAPTASASSAPPAATFAFRAGLCKDIDWSAFEAYGDFVMPAQDISDYRQDVEQIDCLRWLLGPDADGNLQHSDTLTVTVDLGKPQATDDAYERMRGFDWEPIDQPTWEECAIDDRQNSLTVKCKADNMAVWVSAGCIVVNKDPAYRDAVLALVEQIRTLSLA